MNSNYNFPVALVPVKTQDKNILVPKKLAVVRTDSNTPLGLVSDKYELLKHSAVVNGFRKTLEKTKHTEEIRLEKNGAQLFLKYTLPGIKFEVQKGDAVSLQMFVKNSYDGSNALQVMLGAYRLVCTNGMVIGKQFFSYSQKHIGDHGDIEVEKLNGVIQHLTDSFEKMLPHMQAMTKAKITRPIEELFNQKKVRIPSYLLALAQQEYEENTGKTVWDYYNSLTSAVTHDMKKDSIKASLKYGKVVWNTALWELQK